MSEGKRKVECGKKTGNNLVNGKNETILSGVRAGIPIILGFIPVGIAYAIMARQAGFSAAETVVMSLTVFAGASQMMAVGMYTQGAVTAAIIIATFMINLRHIIMSTCVYSGMKRSGILGRLVSAFAVTDETFAVFTTTEEKNRRLSFFIPLGLVSYLSWVGGSAIGALTSVFIPERLTMSMGIALYAMFIGLVFPGIRKNARLGLLVVITACVNTALSYLAGMAGIDKTWAMIASTLACAAVGIFVVGDGENAVKNDTDGREAE